MGRNEALDTILNQFLSTRDKGQAKEDLNCLIEMETKAAYNNGFNEGNLKI
jgi:hypothetical protein